MNLAEISLAKAGMPGSPAAKSACLPAQIRDQAPVSDSFQAGLAAARQVAMSSPWAGPPGMAAAINRAIRPKARRLRCMGRFEAYPKGKSSFSLAGEGHRA